MQTRWRVVPHEAYAVFLSAAVSPTGSEMTNVVPFPASERATISPPMPLIDRLARKTSLADRVENNDVVWTFGRRVLKPGSGEGGLRRVPASWRSPKQDRCRHLNPVQFRSHC